MSTPARKFEELLVWQKAHQLVLAIYHLTSTFPHAEMYGLTSQLRRAAVSVPANIAEGFRKRSKPDKARFMNIGQASLEETRYYVLLARDLGYHTDTVLFGEIDEVARMLDAYSSSILRSVSLSSLAFVVFVFSFCLLTSVF